MTSDARSLAALQDEQLKRAAERSFRAFVRQAWAILEPSTPFLATWHVDFVYEFLESVTAGDIRRLVINVPPRYGKTLLVTILWPVWEWLRHPGNRYLFASYSEALAIQQSRDRRQVIQSPWYQDHWGDRVRLLADENEKTAYRNTQRGLMVATSIGGTVTGRGGDRLIVDDPHTPLGVESDALRQRAIDFFHETLVTRLDDKRRGAIVVVKQRLHPEDLTAACLDLGYTHLCLPAREGPVEIAERRVELGTFGFAGQYQQAPSPRGGGMFKRDWWIFYDDLPSDLEEYAQSWDLSVKGGPGHDYVVGLVAARKGADIYLIDRVKGQFSFPETLVEIRRLSTQYPMTRSIFVEDTANGPAVIDTLKHEIPGIIAVSPQGDKMQRAVACVPRVEAGNVYLPRPTAPTGRRMALTPLYVKTLLQAAWMIS